MYIRLYINIAIKYISVREHSREDSTVIRINIYRWQIVNSSGLTN